MLFAVREFVRRKTGGSHWGCPASRQQFRLAKQARRVNMRLGRAKQRIHTVVAAVKCTKREEGRVCAVYLGKRLSLGGSRCPRLAAKVSSILQLLISTLIWILSHLHSLCAVSFSFTLVLPPASELLLRRVEWVARRSLLSTARPSKPRGPCPTIPLASRIPLPPLRLPAVQRTRLCLFTVWAELNISHVT